MSVKRGSSNLSKFTLDARDIGFSEDNFQIVSNLPYGERLGDVQKKGQLQLDGLYRQLGQKWASLPKPLKGYRIGGLAGAEKGLMNAARISVGSSKTVGSTFGSSDGISRKSLERSAFLRQTTTISSPRRFVMTKQSNPLEAAILELGEQFYAEMKGEIPGVFNKDFWQRQNHGMGHERPIL